MGAGEGEPAFAYSLGLYESFGHPEIIIFGLDLDTMHQLINDAGERIRKGESFEDGQEDDQLLDNYRCAFQTVNVKHYERLFGFTGWYYKGWNFPAVQLVWPDMHNRFPWDVSFDESYRADQPLLA